MLTWDDEVTPTPSKPVSSGFSANREASLSPLAAASSPVSPIAAMPQPALRTLVQQGVLDQARISALREAARAQVEAAVEQARGEAQPDPAREDWTALCERDLVNLRAS